MIKIYNKQTKILDHNIGSISFNIDRLYRVVMAFFNSQKPSIIESDATFFVKLGAFGVA